MGRYCSYLLPKQTGGTSHIKVNPTQVLGQMNHPVEGRHCCVKGGDAERDQIYLEVLHIYDREITITSHLPPQNTKLL